jgi:hypothetical protein
MIAKKTPVKINIVQLNNKSRKGLYLYVKAKGLPSRFYKFGSGQGQIDATKQYYEDRYIKKKKDIRYRDYNVAYQEKFLGIKPSKRTSIHRKAEQYLAKVKKEGTLTSQLKKGVSTSTIKNILVSGNSDFSRVKKELLENLVIDKSLSKILTSEENFNKLKNRLDFVVLAKNDNETLIELSAHGKTLNKVKTELKKALEGNTGVSKHKYRFLDYLKKNGWEGERKGEGTIKYVEVKVTLRKG